MIKLIWSNQYVKIIVGIIIGMGMGYILLSEKVKTKEGTSDTTTKARIVKVEKKGVTITTTDFITDTKTKTKETEKTNYKDSFVLSSFTLYNKGYAVDAGFGHFITNNFGVFVGVSYYNNATYREATSLGGKAGVILKF